LKTYGTATFGRIHGTSTEEERGELYMEDYHFVEVKALAFVP